MRNLLIVVLVVMALGACGCAAGGAGALDDRGVRRVIVVRHAEKRDDASDDPGLTESGRVWAEELGRFCVSQGVTGVVSTPYRRTMETAWPTAREAGVRVQMVPASSGVEAHAEGVVRVIEGDGMGGNWLVVGHSNTVGAVIARLMGGGPAAVEIGEMEYGRVFVVDIGGRGGPVEREGLLRDGEFVLSGGG